MTGLAPSQKDTTKSLDPAWGSRSTVISSARFVSEHKQRPAAELAIHRIKKTIETRSR